MTRTQLTLFIRQQAKLLGFDACGFAHAEALPELDQHRYKTWLNEGLQGEMSYMERNLEKRLDPTKLVEGCRTIVSVALNYSPSRLRDDRLPKIARFAYGLDYHYVIRGKLQTLLQKIREEGIDVQGRVFSDSAPVMERYWAWKAGLGWIGKNQNLLIPGCGSYFLLGEMLIDLELDYDKPMENRCGTCTKCLTACPTNALDGNHMDARKCLSYLTIEKKGSFSSDESEVVRRSGWVFGCDICQEVCPWNRFEKPNQMPEFQPREQFLTLDEKSLRELDEASFHLHFSGTCLERTGLQGIRRNLNAE
jgi:epoxyqueuosine reductase